MNDTSLQTVFDEVLALSEEYARYCDRVPNVFAGRRPSLKIDSVQSQNFCDPNDTELQSYVNIVDGTAYVCLNKLEINDEWTLTGECDIIFNIFQEFKVNQGENINDPEKSVVFNIRRTKPVAFSGGGGGLSCCNAVANGSIIAPSAEVNLSPGRVSGVVVSGDNVVLSFGLLIDCPPP